VDARSDIFSLGSVIYELVTDRAAFEGETASDVIAEILKVEPASPSGVGAGPSTGNRAHHRPKLYARIARTAISRLPSC
jgi:serine/threonine protein kinase